VSDADRNRLVACRACGNRVARDARRCPACGTREPTAAATAPPPEAPADVVPPAAPLAGRREPAPEAAPPRGGVRPQRMAPRPAVRRRRRGLVAMLVVLFALTAAGVTAVYVTRPPSSSPSPAPSFVPAPPAESLPTPAVAPPPPAASATNAPSRSRGRTEWLFFFKPGDWLTRMADDGLLGVVVRVEKTHAFADGSTGPAYVVQSMDGEERVLDADELERTARLR
jgi:hypothetical protein